MKKIMLFLALFVAPLAVGAQDLVQPSDSMETPKLINLEQALQIAFSENASVKISDMEIERSGYARKGSYSSLFPQVDGSGAYQRTIKKQVMYMDFDMGAFGGGSSTGTDTGTGSGTDVSTSSSSGGGIEVGRWNTWSAGVSASMPLINAQLWQSLKISDMDVELAVEKARNSRLEMVNQVKQAYFNCLLSKEAFEVYKSVYENALNNLDQTQKKYNAQRASELDLARAKTTVANAIPNVYDAESSIMLSLWQLKAVMGVSLEENIDVAETLADYADHMLFDLGESGSYTIDNNSSLKQMEIQLEQLASSVKMQQYASLPSLAVAFSYSMNAMTNDFKFSEYKWSPYSYVGLSLSIPIFAGGKRYHAVKAAKMQVNQIQTQKIDTERQLRIAIRQNLNKMETSMKSYGAAQSAMESAQKAYDIASKSYNVGRSTLTDLNDAQLALTQAKLSVSQAVYNFVIAKATLESTVGADFIDDQGNVKLNNTYDNE